MPVCLVCTVRVVALDSATTLTVMILKRLMVMYVVIISKLVLISI